MRIVPVIIDYDGDEYADDPPGARILQLHYVRTDGTFFDRYRHGEIMAYPDQGYVGAYGISMN